MKISSTKIIIFLILILLGCGWYISVLYRKANAKIESSPIEEMAKKKVETEAKKIADEVDKNGLQHTIFKMVKEIDQSAVDKIKSDLLDTVAQLNIERDKVRQVLAVAANLTIDKQKLERRVNEIATVYSHSDKNLSLTVNVPKDSLIPADFTGSYDADLMAVQYNDGNWFKGTDRYLDIYSNDRRFTIKGARTMTIKQDKPFFNANLSVGPEYNFRTKSFMAGPDLNLKFGRLQVRGRYLYDPTDRNWTWTTSAGYTLLSLK